MAVTIELNPEAPVQAPSSGTAGDDIVARRKILHELHDRQDLLGEDRKIDLEKMTQGPAKAKELVESVIVQTPVGEIEFGPPAGVSLTMRLAMIATEQNLNRTLMAMLRTLMCVRKIDGQPVTPVTNMVEAQALANMLTDPVMDFLFETYMETWPPPAAGELQILRKNKRVT